MYLYILQKKTFFVVEYLSPDKELELATFNKYYVISTHYPLSEFFHKLLFSFHKKLKTEIVIKFEREFYGRDFIGQYELKQFLENESKKIEKRMLKKIMQI